LRDQGASAPRWDEELFEGVLEELRVRFEGGERIAIRVPVSVKRKRGAIQDSHFDVFVQKDDRLEGGQDHHIRKGITIPAAGGLRNKGVIGLLVADDDALTTLLGDSENPSHTEWRERSDKIRERYEQGASRVRFVKNALQQIVTTLSRPSRGREEDLLR